MVEASAPKQPNDHDSGLTKKAGRYLDFRQRRIEAFVAKDDATHESVRFLHLIEAGVLRAAELATAYRLSGSLAVREVAVITPSIHNFDRFLPSIAESVTTTQE